MKQEKLNTFLMRTVAVLLMLVLLSSGIVSGRYARYTTRQNLEDSARVARFAVTEETNLFSERVPIQIIPGDVATNEIAVANDSEVAIRYTITADNPFKNLPLKFYIRVGEQRYPAPYSAEMAPSQHTDFILETEWAGTADLSYSGKVDLIEITLDAVQID